MYYFKAQLPIYTRGIHNTDDEISLSKLGDKSKTRGGRYSMHFCNVQVQIHTRGIHNTDDGPSLSKVGTRVKPGNIQRKTHTTPKQQRKQ